MKQAVNGNELCHYVRGEFSRKQDALVNKLFSLVNDWKDAPCTACDPMADGFSCEWYTGSSCGLADRVAEIDFEVGFSG